MNNKKKFYLIFGAQVCMIGLAIFLFFSDFSIIKFFKNKEYVFISQKQECDLHKKSCTITLNATQKLTLSLSPKAIPLMKNLTFSVTTQGIKAKSLQLSIYATNMNMGVHNFTLEKKSDGLYEGTGILPTCIVGNMNWNADITSKVFFKNSAARFHFTTDI